MKKITLLFLLTTPTFAQTNPVLNPTYFQTYENMTNYFSLYWEEPETPHDELLGYNIYRETELYRFQTENSVHYLPEGANADVDFLYYTGGNPEGYFAHVTAVYAGGAESGYTETFFVYPPALKVDAFEKQKAVLYPNPTSGILNIGNKNVSKISLYDSSGKLINEFNPSPQLDLSGYAKGTYFLKLASHEGMMVERIVIE